MEWKTSLYGVIAMAAVTSTTAQAELAASAEAAATTEPLPTIAVAAAPASRTDTAESPKSSNRLIDEVVVTAQKREEAIQDVPVAVAAFTEEQLSALGVENSQDLGRVTPGLQFTEFAGFSMIFLRGIGTDSFLPYSDPSVATYIDGLYIPAQQSQFNSLGGVERVEVLKGPQGTLFGRNSTGGAVNIITKQPSLSQLEMSAQASIGNYASKKAQAYTSIPLLDSLAVSVSASYNSAESYYRQVVVDSGTNPFVAEPTDTLDDYRDRGKAARVKLRWVPLDELDVTLTWFRSLQESPTSLVQSLKHPSPLATLLGVQANRDYEIERNVTNLTIGNSTVYYGNATWNLPWFDVKGVVGHQDTITNHSQYDYDQSQKSLVEFGADPVFVKLTTAELQISSNDSSWAADRLKWIAGLYYYKSQGGFDPVYLQVAGSLPRVGANLLPPDILDAVEAAIAQLPIFSQEFPGIRLDVHGVLETHAQSAFLQGTYSFTDWMSLTLGGRYNEEDRFLIDQFVSSTDESGSVTLIPWNTPKVDDSNFSPKVGLEFRPKEDMLVYTSYTRGFKSGTYNGVAIYLPPTYVKPEIVDAYELGAKTEWLNRTLRINGAIFQNKIKDQQVTFVSLFNGGAITFENAGSTRIRGAELEVLSVPMPETNPGLVIGLNGSYIDGVFTDYKDASGYDETTGLFFTPALGTGQDFTGKEIPRSPKWSGTLVLSQSIDVGNGSLEIAGDAYYNGGFYYTAQNTQQAKEDSYTLLNARISYLYTPWQVRVTLFGQNLGEAKYSLAQFTTDFGTNETLGPPRTYGLRLNWDF